MRAATLAETDALIEAGDAMAEKIREVLVSVPRPWSDELARLVDAWVDATRQVAP